MSTGYYERLKRTTRPTAAELEHQKRISSQGPTIREIQQKLEAIEQATLDTANFLGRPDGEVPVDDGVAPAAPTSIAVELGRRQIIASWAVPPETDHVEQTRVITSRASNAAVVRTQYTRSSSITVPELDPYRANGTTRESYNLKIVHFDRWGRQSAITSSGPHLPALSVADEVDFAALGILGRIQGQLPNTNLATLQDAILLGDGIIQARSMTSMDAALLNLWVQDAAIVDAKVKSMSVGKLDAGILSVAVEISTGGLFKLKGSGRFDVVTGNPEVVNVRMDSGGLSLKATSNLRESPTFEKASKITPLGPNPWAEINFVDNTQRRALYMRSEGSGGTNPQVGTVLLDALANPSADPTLAPSIRLEAGANIVNGVDLGGPRTDISTTTLAIHASNVNFDFGLTSNQRVYITNGGFDVNGSALFRSDPNVLGTFQGTTRFTDVDVFGKLTVPGGEWVPSVTVTGLITAGGSIRYNFPAGWDSPGSIHAMVDATGNGVLTDLAQAQCTLDVRPGAFAQVRNLGGTSSFLRMMIYR